MPSSPMRAEQQQGLQPEQLEQEQKRERREKQREKKQREQQGGGGAARDAACEALREALSGAASHWRLVGSFRGLCVVCRKPRRYMAKVHG
jgi:hypothetical protein